jgi:hypothetical protein
MTALVSLILLAAPLQKRGFVDLRIGAHVAGVIKRVDSDGLLTIRRTADAPPHGTIRAKLYGVIWPRSGKQRDTVLAWLRKNAVGKPAQFMVRDQAQGVWWVSGTLDDMSKPGADLDGYLVYMGMVDTRKKEFPYAEAKAHAQKHRLGIWAKP